MIIYENSKRRKIIENETWESADLDVALVKAIHSVQQLEQNRLDFTVGAGLYVKSFCRDGVDFVDEDDSGGVFAREPEHVAHHARSLSKVFLHEFRPDDANERSCGVMRDGFDEHGLSRTCDGQCSVVVSSELIIRQLERTYEEAHKVTLLGE